MGLPGEANIFHDDLYIGKSLVQLPLKTGSSHTLAELRGLDCHNQKRLLVDGLPIYNLIKQTTNSI